MKLANFTSRLLRRGSLKRGLIAFGLTVTTLGLLFNHMGFLINTSSSLPHRYFLHFLRVKPQKGDITVLNHGGDKRLIKQIIGDEGDRVFYDDQDTLWVGDVHVGSLKPSNSKGVPLYRISAGVIPSGFVFLFAPHADSLDSRYTEIGLVSKHQLEGKAIPLW